MTTVTVTVVSGYKLPAADMGSKSDPYVILSLQGGRSTRFQTRTINNNINPTWNETFSFPNVNIQSDSILFQVYDKDTFSKDDELGKVSFPLSRLGYTSSVEETLNLMPVGKYRGGALSVRISAPNQGGQGGFGMQQQQGGYGMPPQQGGYGMPPQQGGYGMPPQQGGFGMPPAQGSHGHHGHHGHQQQGFGGPPQGGLGMPPQQGGYGQGFGMGGPGYGQGGLGF
eukprot:TRINITY_DN103_c0_g1_i1.p1 TRINITY_DN103_c0_g1~~TRINITY_DN103_c0_g1_i1.p1  ORF type:complete len:226 (-),score=59.71 TRINITY_DN103_c0_g1_i1:120-797(-)